MYIEGSPRMIKHLRLKAYGKINLALDVLGRRADGYHEVRMIMQTVGLHDRIDLYVTQEPGIKIETNLFYLPDNEQNLAHKAAGLLMEEFGIRQGLAGSCRTMHSNCWAAIMRAHRMHFRSYAVRDIWKLSRRRDT